MTTTFMAAINKGVVETEILSESNSVTYKFEVAGGTNYSGPGYIKRNTQELTGAVLPGLNLCGFDAASNNSPEVKSYLLTTTDSSMNTSFATYMNTTTHPVIIIFSGTNLKSSPSVDAWFAAAGSVAWPGQFMINNYSVGYVAFYSTTRKKIIAEKAVYSDGTNTDAAVYELVCDTLDDIGALGFAKKIVNDESEYTTTSAYEFKKYPSDAAVNLMSAYGLAANAKMYLSADLKQSQSMLVAGMKTRLTVQWFNGSTPVGSSFLETDGTEYKQAFGYTQAPTGANGFSITASRYPRNDSIIGLAWVRNVSFAEVLVDGTKGGLGAIIGVNGIRAGTIDEESITNPQLEMDMLAHTSTSNVVKVISVKEGNHTI